MLTKLEEGRRFDIRKWLLELIKKSWIKMVLLLFSLLWSVWRERNKFFWHGWLSFITRRNSGKDRRLVAWVWTVSCTYQSSRRVVLLLCLCAVCALFCLTLFSFHATLLLCIKPRHGYGVKSVMQLNWNWFDFKLHQEYLSLGALRK